MQPTHLLHKVIQVIKIFPHAWSRNEIIPADIGRPIKTRPIEAVMVSAGGIRGKHGLPGLTRRRFDAASGKSSLRRTPRADDGFPVIAAELQVKSALASMTLVARAGDLSK